MNTTTPRNTHLRIADIIRTTVKQGGYTNGQLPTVCQLAHIHAVGTGVITRALNLLADDGIIEPGCGSGWYVTGTRDLRPMDVRLRELLMEDSIEPGSRFPTESELCERFSTSRPTIRNAIGRLIGEGLLSERRGRYRFVMAVPTSKERP